MAVSIEAPKPSLAGELLELSQFESYFVADDRPEYPMGFYFMATLDGQLEPEAFQRAMKTAIGRNPLLRARLSATADGKEAWLVSDDTTPVITWVESNWPTGSSNPRPINLREQTGLHTWIEATKDHTRIAWQFHHACADGLGAMNFIEDVFVAYASELGCGEGLEIRPLDPAALALRLTHDRPEGDLPPVWKIIRHIATQTYNHFARKPVVLQPSTPSQAPPQSAGIYPQFETWEADESLSEALRSRAAGMEATANDLMLAVLFQTLAQWQQLHPGPGTWFRVLMPTNLRKKQHDPSPTCNILGYAFIDRKPGECLSASSLVPGIATQTGLIKRYRLGRSFLDGVSLARSLGLLKRFVNIRRSEATVVFTNPGELTRPFQAKFPLHEGKLQIGGLVLERLEVSAPLRPGTRVSVVATRLRRKVHLTWATDPLYFSTADRTELIRRYEENLRALIAEPKASTPT